MKMKLHPGDTRESEDGIEIDTQGISLRNEPEPPTYEEQFNRLKRSYNRLIQIDDGCAGEFDSNRDDFYTFFLNCHHLKDWLMNDERLREKHEDIEGYINEHKDLLLCADICNAHKHLVLNRPRSGEDPRLGRQKARLAFEPQKTRLKVTIEIETTSGTRDAFDLARSCMGLWKTFLA